MNLFLMIFVIYSAIKGNFNRRDKKVLHFIDILFFASQLSFYIYENI